MNVGIIGSGGREHAICNSLKISRRIKEIYCFPGNAGTSFIAKNIELDLTNFEKLKKLIKQFNIDLIIIGPEKPLVDGLVDYLDKFQIKVFGPNKIAAKLEGSKIFTKELCQKYNIPTAKFGIFKSKVSTYEHLKKINFPIVIKADNLASGKGVYICKNFIEAKIATDEIFGGKFGHAEKLLIEEFLEGEEMSFFTIHDGNIFKTFGTAQDHKRVFEGDKGKNTGGMGSYSPSRLINDDLDNKIIKKIIEPTLKGIKELGTIFKGFLYAGLMIKNNEPYLIEYNVRMGDPECQTILPKLNNDLFDVIKSCLDKNLDKLNFDWSKDESLCIVLCSKGYPEKFINEIEINNLKKLNINHNEFIFHAGTKIINDKIYSNGGRVLNFVKVSKNFKKSRTDIIQMIKSLNWENGFFRSDIGYKVIGK